MNKSRTLLNDVYKAKINYYNVVRLLVLRIAIVLILGMLLLGVAYYLEAAGDLVQSAWYVDSGHFYFGAATVIV